MFVLVVEEIMGIPMVKFKSILGHVCGVYLGVDQVLQVEMVLPSVVTRPNAT